MRRALEFIFLLIFCVHLGPSPRGLANTDSSRLVVHLLDYLAKDYGGAVSDDGKVLSASEYAEQIEFSNTVVQTAQSLTELKDQPELLAEVRELAALIARKAPPADVIKLARKLQAAVLTITKLQVAPTQWPDLAKGRQLYDTSCVICHGREGRGDGAGGAGLDPAPANFRDDELMHEASPLQAFNTIRLGVQGTGMPPFPQFSDSDVWNLAFYVVSLRHHDQSRAPMPAVDDSQLELLATHSDAALLAKLGGDRKVLASLRTHSAAAEGPSSYLALAQRLLSEAQQTYEKTDAGGAKTLALRAYLEGIEPVEARIRTVDPSAVVAIEEKMGAVRGAITQSAPTSDVAAAVAAAKAEIDRIAKTLDASEMSPTMAFTTTSAILLREGFEAVLVILTLLSVVRAMGSRRAALAVHAGWIAALVCGVLAWLFSGYLLDISGAQRELLEGFTSILAVIVLLVVGFWMHSKTEVGRWNHFLKVKVQDAVANRNMFGLAAIAFVAVFREAFETVLFLRAIWIEGGQSAKTAMGAGFAVTFVALLIGAWAAVHHSARIPVRKLFTASSAIMAVLAVILTGKGAHALQEAGFLDVTFLPWALRADWLGIYPSYETWIPQLLVLGVIAILWQLGKRPARLAI